MENSSGFVPKHVFFTRGVGRDKNKLIAFEKALRAARIQPFNLVSVSSILPPRATEVTIDEGLKHLKPGQIVFNVMARNESNEYNRMLSSAIGCAKPADNSHYGYLSEHHSFGQPAEVSEEYAEDLAAVMLATTLGISDFDIENDWDARKNAFIVNGKIVETKGINATAVVEKHDEWTCVLAAAVFVD